MQSTNMKGEANVDFIYLFVCCSFLFRITKCTRPYYVFPCRVEKYFLFALIFPQRGFYKAGGSRIRKRKRRRIPGSNAHYMVKCKQRETLLLVLLQVLMSHQFKYSIKTKIKVIFEAARRLLVESGGCQGRPPPGSGG